MKRTLILAGAMMLGSFALLAPAVADAHEWDRGGRVVDVHYYHHRGPDIRLWHSGYWNHGYYHGRLGWWWVVGGVWYFYTAPVYPYPDPYTPPVVVQAPPVVQTPPPAVVAAPPAVAPAPEPAQVWYYCKAKKQYYPYVTECPTGWKTVPAQPSN